MAQNPEKNIWLVDDNPGIILLVRTILDKPGLKIEDFGELEEALRRAEEGIQTPDLVITDRDMPSMAGEVFAERLQEILGRRVPPTKVPIVVLSAHNMTDNPGVWKKFQDAGAVANIHKPFPVFRLVAVVDSSLNLPKL